MTEKDFAEQLWKYYELHSNIRTQMMNFYIILESLFLTGLLATLSLDDSFSLYRKLICFAVIFFSLIFKLLDLRFARMIIRAKKAMSMLESKYIKQEYEFLKIFTNEYTETKRYKQVTSGVLLNMQYFFFAVLAIVLMFIV